jgi:hypothetical protein
MILAGPVTVPNLRRAPFGATRETIILEFDQQVAWDDELASQFYLDGEKGKIAGGSVVDAILSLTELAESPPSRFLKFRLPRQFARWKCNVLDKTCLLQLPSSSTIELNSGEGGSI